MKKYLSLICFSLAAMLLLSACGAQAGEDGSGASGKPVIAVSIVPEQTFVTAVCGDLAEVVVLIPPGYSPENYEPQPREMEQFSKAALYFSIGVPTEETNLLPLVSKNTKIVPLAEVCKAEYAELDMDGGRDPHIWLSPKRAVVMVQKIAEEMSALDPNNSKVYAANAKSFEEKLLAADGEIASSLSDIKNRSFIVFHPAFGYFADDYGLKMYALEDGGKEATATRLQELTDLAKANNIRVIFYQAEIDSSQCQAFAEEIGGKAVKLDPLSGDYIENLKAMANAISEELN
ncbi:MAG: zinc ABC transporter substrate-binding protein [Oscillospiraceae bacterium]